MNYTVKLTEEYIQSIYEQQVLHMYSVGTSRGTLEHYKLQGEGAFSRGKNPRREEQSKR